MARMTLATWASILVRARGFRPPVLFRRQPLLTFLASRVTDQYWVLFATFGVLFGYVYSRNVWFPIHRVQTRFTPVLVFLLAAYAFHVNIGSGLNGVRMWTAPTFF